MQNLHTFLEVTIWGDIGRSDGPKAAGIMLAK